ncbi:MAG: hypothetical protein ACTSO7_12440 [Candidatus Heimdallarchaeota archaeon]
MPVVLIGTVAETGQTNLGPYSLCFPFRIAGQGRYAMKLNARSDSNTAMNIVRTGVCSINFITDDKKYMENCVLLGFPGDTTEEKMEKSKFTLLPSSREEEEREDGVQYPEIVDEAVQVFECSLDPEIPYWIDEVTTECHMILRVDKIVLKSKWKKALLEGKGFPALPIDYGYRDNTNFWLTKHSKPYSIGIPESKGVDVSTVRYAADRCDPDVKWTDEACAKIVKVPRIFLGRVVKQITERAKEEGLTEITPEYMDKIRDKRAAEK